MRLGGEPVRASAAPCEWRARLVDEGPGFRLFLERHPAVTEELGDGVVLCGDTLRVLAASGLEGRELEALARGRSFTPDQASELASEVLPALRKRIAVVVETGRLPEAHSEPPRLVLETSREGEALSVLATLVYGDPPRARVDAGRLVPLRGALPLRDADAEQRLTAHLRSALRLEPGLRLRLEPAEALAFVARLEGFRGSVLGSAQQDFFLAPPLAPRFAGGRDDLALEFSAGGGDGPRVEAARVLEAWGRGESLLGLPDGGFAPLPADWLARHGALVADLLAAREAAGGRLAPASLPDLARLCDELGAAPPPSLAALRPLLDGFAGIPEAPLPEDFRGELRDYQRRGASLAALPRRRRPRRAPRRRHGARQDRTGALRRARAHPRRRADERALRLGGGGRALSPRAAPLPVPRRGAQPRPRSGPHLHELRAAAPRARAPRGRPLGLRRPRRGPVDQEPGEPGRPGRAGAAREGPHRAHGNAGREPPGGAVEPVRLPLPGPAREPPRLRDARRAAHRGGRSGGRRAPAPAHPPLRAAPQEIRGRPRAAAEAGAARARRPLGGGARRLRRAPRGDAPRGGRAAARRRQRARRPRGAAAPAPGVLSPGVSCRVASAAGSAKLEALLERLEHRRRRRPQGAGVLAVDLAPRPRRAGPRRGGHRLHRASTAAPATGRAVVARFQRADGPAGAARSRSAPAARG